MACLVVGNWAYFDQASLIALEAGNQAASYPVPVAGSLEGSGGAFHGRLGLAQVGIRRVAAACLEYD